MRGGAGDRGRGSNMRTRKNEKAHESGNVACG